MINIKIENEQSNKRVDIALSEISEFSRSMIQKIIITGNLSCNNELVQKPNKKTQVGEVYSLTPIKNHFSKITPEPYDLDILFEDEFLLVVNKPAELITHPGAGHFNNTLVNKVAHHCKLSDIAGPEKLGTVHRLDKGVSGCIIFAKNNLTHTELNEQFAKRIVKKKYIAICHNTLIKNEVFAEDYIARSKTDRKKMAIYDTSGKIAQMQFKIKQVIEKNKKIFSLIKCNPITGRMHQIRLQLSQRKLPILNDKLYGKNEEKQIQELFKERIALHAMEIEFVHPKTKKTTNVISELPKEFAEFLK